MKILVLTPTACALVVLSGCAAEDKVESARERLAERNERPRRDVQREYRQRRDKIKGCVQEYLAQLEQSIPSVEGRAPRSIRGRSAPQEIDEFTEGVLRNIDEHWTRTLRANDLPPPSVRYEFFPPRAVRVSGCGITAGSDAALYCPADDTIYVSQQFAADLYNGVVRGLPGESAATAGRPGIRGGVRARARVRTTSSRSSGSSTTASAGGAAVRAAGRLLVGHVGELGVRGGDLRPSDLDEIPNTALAVGDFDAGNAQHHGTPEERRDAVLAASAAAIRRSAAATSWTAERLSGVSQSALRIRVDTPSNG